MAQLMQEARCDPPIAKAWLIHHVPSQLNDHPPCPHCGMPLRTSEPSNADSAPGIGIEKYGGGTVRGSVNVKYLGARYFGRFQCDQLLTRAEVSIFDQTNWNPGG